MIDNINVLSLGSQYLFPIHVSPKQIHRIKTN